MQDNFNIHEWRLNRAINEIDEINEDEIGLSDILARDLFKLQGKISDDLFYKLRKAINSQDPAALARAKEIMSRIKPGATLIYMGEEKGQCPECGCKTEGSMCNECGYMEEVTFTDKHDDNPELKGGQKDLPDELQVGILKKEGEDHEVSMAQASLKSIISSASELMNKIGNEEINLPGWIQGHITNAENYIDQANQGYHELEPSVKDIDAMDMVTEEVSANKKTKAKNALAIHLRSAMEDGNKENIEQVKDARDRINNTKSVDELVNILGEFGYKDDEIEDILG